MKLILFTYFIGAFIGTMVGYILCRVFDKHVGKAEEEPLEIKIKYFDERHHGGLKVVHKIEKGDWIDLYTAEDVTVHRGEVVKIPLGVGMILPEGYEAHVIPRSSTPDKFGIEMANSIGMIDNCYNGDGDEWHFPAQLAPGCNLSKIRKGSKICQFRIVKNQPKIFFNPVDHLNETDRGGFGSTGA